MHVCRERFYLLVDRLIDFLMCRVAPVGMGLVQSTYLGRYISKLRLKILKQAVTLPSFYNHFPNQTTQLITQVRSLNLLSP